MKTLSVKDLIEELNKIKDKSKEIYVRGDTYNIVPCNEVCEISGDGDSVLLACHMEFNQDKAICDLLLPRLKLYGAKAIPQLDSLLFGFYQLDDEAREELKDFIQLKAKNHTDPERAKDIENIERL